MILENTSIGLGLGVGSYSILNDSDQWQVEFGVKCILNNALFKFYFKSGEKIVSDIGLVSLSEDTQGCRIGIGSHMKKYSRPIPTI